MESTPLDAQRLRERLHAWESGMESPWELEEGIKDIDERYIDRYITA